MFRSRDISKVFVYSSNSDFKICDVIIGTATYWKLHLCLFLLNTKYYFGQIQVKYVSNIFLIQCWRLENSSRSFYYFIEMTKQQDLATFDSWRALFFISPNLSFQKSETWQSWCWLLINWSRLLNWKRPGT